MFWTFPGLCHLEPEGGGKQMAFLSSSCNKTGTWVPCQSLYRPLSLYLSVYHLSMCLSMYLSSISISISNPYLCCFPYTQISSRDSWGTMKRHRADWKPSLEHLSGWQIHFYVSLPDSFLLPPYDKWSVPDPCHILLRNIRYDFRALWKR